MAIDTNQLRNRATGFMAGFSMGQRMVMVVAAVTLLGGGVAFTQWASRPNMVPLFSNLSADDASAITAKLQSSHTKYDLTDGGATIRVAQSDVYQTRLDMAGDGLPSGGSQGYKLLDKQGITTSEFREHVDYQRALEGELSKTIGAINGVQAATVHLVIPQSDVFSDDNRKPSASVLVKTAPGKSLAGGQVQSVVNLVASSVEGLDPTNVTVADGNGRMLAAPGQAATTGDDEAQHQATSSLEDNLTGKIQSMLTPLLGEGKAVVATRAELNWDTSQTTAETYNPLNKPVTALSQRSTSEVYGPDASTAATGCVGAGTPTNATACVNPQGTNTSGSGYTKTDGAQDNAVDKEVTQTSKTPGSIKRVSVAVLLDSNVPNVDVAEVEKLVNQAAGLQTARGDTVAVSRMPFDKTAANNASDELKAAEKAKKKDQTMGLIKTAVTLVIIMVVLTLLFFTTKKRAARYMSTPISMSELDNVLPALPAPDLTSDSPVDSPEALERAKIDREIGDLIERQPEEVAQLLRSWLADRRG